MTRAPLFVAAAFVALLVAGAVAVYLYDSSRENLIAEGITVGGVDIGGMTAGDARREIRRRIQRPLRRPVEVRADGERYTLSAQRAKVRTDVHGMVEDAVAESREGNVLTRTYRDLTGAGLDTELPARIAYSRRAVEDFVARIDEEISRPAQDAEVVASASGLSTVAGRTGVVVRDERLMRRVVARLESAHGTNTVKAHTKVVRPEVTESELAEQHPHYLTVDRGSFQLRYYENLELIETYTVAVGQAGYDTPTGLYSIQNKAVDPAWSVPDSEWAGDLAGRVIPGGAPNNPLKARWLGIYDGAGIHGTDATSSLGSAASHGCIRMAIPDVIELYDRVPVETPVYIG